MSRPRVSNDNPYSEALFKTTKYCPAYPGSFASIKESQEFLDDLRDYYNPFPVICLVPCLVWAA